MAAESCPGPTSSGTSAEAAGISNAVEMPSSMPAMTMWKICTCPVATSQPTATASAACTICVAMRMRRLSCRSAMAPPYMVSASMGMPEAKFTRPRVKALVVSAVTTQPCASICIQVPSSEMTSPPM